MNENVRTDKIKIDKTKMNLEKAVLPQMRRDRQGQQGKSLIELAYRLGDLLACKPWFLRDLCVLAPLR